MRPAEHPERLRLAAAPGSTLQSGLSAARMRGPSDAQLRALEASLAASLGAVVTGTVASAVVDAAPAVPAMSTGESAFLSAGALKVTAAFVILAATVGGVAVYRHAGRSNPPAIVAAPAHLADRSSLPAEVPVPPQLVPAPSVPTPLSAGAERIANAPHARRHVPAPDELALIARAQRTLASDPAAALLLIEENRRALAQSAFAQEAEVIAVAALARLGRMDEASARAARFIARFPDSVHAPRMSRVAAIIK